MDVLVGVIAFLLVAVMAIGGTGKTTSLLADVPKMQRGFIKEFTRSNRDSLIKLKSLNTIKTITVDSDISAVNLKNGVNQDIVGMLQSGSSADSVKAVTNASDGLRDSIDIITYILSHISSDMNIIATTKNIGKSIVDETNLVATFNEGFFIITLRNNKVSGMELSMYDSSVNVSTWFEYLKDVVRYSKWTYTCNPEVIADTKVPDERYEGKLGCPISASKYYVTQTVMSILVDDGMSKEVEDSNRCIVEMFKEYDEYSNDTYAVLKISYASGKN